MHQTIQDLDEKIAQLKARKAQLAAQKNAAERKSRLRKIIILGAWVLENKPSIVADCKVSLHRPQDRRAFGMPEIAIPSTGGEESLCSIEADPSLENSGYEARLDAPVRWE